MAFCFPLHQCSLKLWNIFVNRETCGLSYQKKSAKINQHYPPVYPTVKKRPFHFKSMQKNKMLCRGEVEWRTACRNLVFGQNNSNVLTRPAQLVLKSEKISPRHLGHKSRANKKCRGTIFSRGCIYVVWASPALFVGWCQIKEWFSFCIFSPL